MDKREWRRPSSSPTRPFTRSSRPENWTSEERTIQKEIGDSTPELFRLLSDKDDMSSWVIRSEFISDIWFRTTWPRPFVFIGTLKFTDGRTKAAKLFLRTGQWPNANATIWQISRSSWSRASQASLKISWPRSDSTSSLTSSRPSLPSLSSFSLSR